MSRFERALAESFCACRPEHCLGRRSHRLSGAEDQFRNELPGITVEVVYPGATASEVEQTIAAPIEQQLNGVEHLRRLRSRSWGDGSYFLDVALDRGVDLNVAQILIQNRVAAALPVLPAQVQGLGVIVRKRSVGLVMIIGVRSSDSSFDDTSLGFFTNIYVKDELAACPASPMWSFSANRISDAHLVGPADADVPQTERRSSGACAGTANRRSVERHASRSR